MSQYKIAVSAGTTTISAVVLNSTVTTLVTNYAVHHPHDGRGPVLAVRGREAVLPILYQLSTVLGRVYGFIMQEIALYGFTPREGSTFEGDVPFPKLSLTIEPVTPSSNIQVI